MIKNLNAGENSIVKEKEFIEEIKKKNMSKRKKIELKEWMISWMSDENEICRNGAKRKMANEWKPRKCWYKSQKTRN